MLCVSITIVGHVLRVSESSVHCGLQHLSGLSNHRHGHPVQVQVRNTVRLMGGDKTDFKQDEMHLLQDQNHWQVK